MGDVGGNQFASQAGGLFGGMIANPGPIDLGHGRAFKGVEGLVSGQFNKMLGIKTPEEQAREQAMAGFKGADDAAGEFIRTGMSNLPTQQGLLFQTLARQQSGQRKQLDAMLARQGMRGASAARQRQSFENVSQRQMNELGAQLEQQRFANIMGIQRGAEAIRSGRRADVRSERDFATGRGDRAEGLRRADQERQEEKELGSLNFVMDEIIPLAAGGK